MMKDLRPLPAIVAVLLAGMASLSAAETPRKGSFWYIIDNITEVSKGAEAVIWVTLPPEWYGQDVTIGEISPEPVAILEDSNSGNRIIEWRLAPEARQSGPLTEPGQEYFHYDFEVREIPVRKHGPFEIVEPYDRGAEEYQRYTVKEPGIQTDGPILDLAREIAGEGQDNVFVVDPTVIIDAVDQPLLTGCTVSSLGEITVPREVPHSLYDVRMTIIFRLD